MIIHQIDITIRDPVAGYRDDVDDGVVGYGGELDIGPPSLLSFRCAPAPSDERDR